MPTIPTGHPPGATNHVWEEPDDDDFSLAFAAWALVLTAGVLAVLVLGGWLVVTSLRGGA